MVTRRQFNLGVVSLAFAALAKSAQGSSLTTDKSTLGYGPLIPDEKGLLDLPKGFNYKIISSLGETMSDGLNVPDRADGMGCLPLDEHRVALIRNHELQPKHITELPQSLQSHKTKLSYDNFSDGVALPGGTSTIVYNLRTGKKEQEFLSLVGTIRNCAGGITPWGSWLSCEESVDKPNGTINQEHGYIFEVPATATGPVQPVPLKDMGRFNHEAAAVEPATGIVYLTEDRGDSLFYRFIPNTYGNLAKGGKLQALVIKSAAQYDTRNWTDASMHKGQWLDTEWITLTNPESPEDDLRLQGYAKGAALFARGEGIHWGENELYFCCTNGGLAQLGQIMQYRPSPYEGTAKEQQNPGQLQLFVESEDKSFYNLGDNLTVMPNGHLLVCEDQYTEVVDNHLRGVNENGELYTFAKLHEQTELAGACFSPDGKTLFVNVYSPTKTLAIQGSWLW
jgi:secreted PhoX family phosphatase